ncbi:MAG: hypothetical protein GW939_00335 [Candidatus Magasanikbacteria bacterium]|nr:hypothetical protein [Candidatus Magasanikbacteria bacterium]NCS71687.1 hypothetical protein [Candidatus Magasanikbacteria bacterium]
MALSTIDQITQLLYTKQKILITFRKNGKGDAIMSASALSLFLEKLGKDVDIICEEFTPPKMFSFVKKVNDIKPHFPHLQKMIVSVDLNHAGLSDISYQVRDGKLLIYITPEQGTLSAEHVQTSSTPFTYDLIITVNTQDLDSLGTLYHDNIDLFYKTPIINIDHDSANEHYGEINHTNLTVSSTAEVLFQLKQHIGEEYIDEDIATALLAAMIANTRSFKNTNVRPHTLTTASKLMEMGADRELIIKHLYQTRSIRALKLWGYALSHLKHDMSLGLVYTLITRDNFIHSGATQQDLEDIIDELIANSPEAKIILLLHEQLDANGNPTIQGILRTQRPFDAKLLTNQFAPKGTKEQVTFCVNKPLSESEASVVDHIRKVLRVIMQ